MKNVLAAVAVMMVSQASFAGDLKCLANVETDAGSGVFNKPVFVENANLSLKSTTRFLLADGTLLRGEELTPEKYELIKDGTLVLNYSFPEGQTQLFMGVVKRNSKNEVQYTNITVAGGVTNKNTFLMSNGAVLSCGQF